ncbi:MAG TPA: hypothetical protein VFS43_31995, partial [Polyangiaceae bacterium]|nr:hypothetical protein [Polyangiaceae bacterium]
AASPAPMARRAAPAASPAPPPRRTQAGAASRRGRAGGADAAAPGKARGARAGGGGATTGGGFDLRPYLAHLGARAGSKRPGLPVRVLLLEAEQVRKAAQAHRATLEALPGFAPRYLRDLPGLIEHLAEAEQAWGSQRYAKARGSRGALRKEAEGLRSAIRNAGRYLLRRDAGAQAELARIAEGGGLADLVQDLDDLADFVEAHAGAFAFDRRLPKDTPRRARELAAELRATDRDDGGAIRARNLAAAALEFVLAEVRAAARYLFADAPRKLAPFLGRYETLRKQRLRARRKAEGGRATTTARA